MKLTVVIAGEEQMPTTEAEREEVQHLFSSNALKMNELFQNYFGLDSKNRYMGNFPYPDDETGRCRVAWILSMDSIHTRDAIVACLRAVIRESGLTDISVIKSESKGHWPAQMEIVAMGDSVTNTLVGERRIQATLELLEAWLTRN